MSYSHYPADCYIQKFWDEQAEWSQKTFGSDAERGPLGPLKHLEKEAREAQKEVLAIKDGHTIKEDLFFELADCLFLTLDAARRSGMTLDDLLDTAFQKLEINKQRKWGKPSPNEAVEHVREEV